jgi:hypothetical protein
MRTMSERLLVERTGEGVAEWNRRVSDKGPPDEAALRAWLAKEGVLGYAQDLLVMERFGYPDFMTASAEELIDGQYADRPRLRPVLDAVVEAAAGLGDVAIQARKTYVSLVTPRRTFARIQAAKEHIAVALRLSRQPGGRLHPSTVHETMPVELRLGSLDALDDAAIGWLRKAYEASL